MQDNNNNSSAGVCKLKKICDFLIKKNVGYDEVHNFKKRDCNLNYISAVMNAKKL